MEVKVTIQILMRSLENTKRKIHEVGMPVSYLVAR